jgi:hypothetical protein
MYPARVLLHPKPHSFGIRTRSPWEGFADWVRPRLPIYKRNCQRGSQLIDEIRDQRATRLLVQTRTEFSVITARRSFRQTLCAAHSRRTAQAGFRSLGKELVPLPGRTAGRKRIYNRSSVWLGMDMLQGLLLQDL